jgi:hypothetical protein
VAATLAGRRLTEAHRKAQLRLGVVTVAQMRAVWPLLDPEDLDATTARWLRAAVPLIGNQRRVSALLAARYVTAYRTAELPAAPAYHPAPAVALPVEAVSTSLAVSGPVALKESTARGVPLVRALNTAETRMAGAALRHALTGGRDTIAAAVDDDPRALGWARATSGKPCAFCSLLASRGPVYSEASGNFQAHDHCSCSLEPVYRQDSEWPAGSRRIRDFYDEATLGTGFGMDRLNAFRRAWESAGRTA